MILQPANTGRNTCSQTHRQTYCTCIIRCPRWSQWIVGGGVPMAWQSSTTSEPRLATTTSPSRRVSSKNRSRRGGSDDVGWTTATINRHADRVTTARPHLRAGACLTMFRATATGEKRVCLTEPVQHCKKARVTKSMLSIKRFVQSPH